MAADPEVRRLAGYAARDATKMRRAIDAAWCERPGGLERFVRLMWPVIEPAREFIYGFHVSAICDHLESVSNGEIKRLLVNVPPGTSKSLLTNVFFPAWIWITKPHTRYLCFSYSQALTIRDNIRFRQLIMSNEYKELWGDRFDKNEDQFSLITVGNNKSGFKMASSLGGVATGARAEYLILDDPNNASDVESSQVREGTNVFFQEVLPSRLANPNDGAIVVIQQRVHQSDISGTILEKGMDYVHLMIPMIHDGNPRTTVIGWSDPRSFDPKTGEEIGGEGTLMWPEMYPQRIVDNLRRDMGEVAFAGQYQQIPVPRGGAIFNITDWCSWPEDSDEKKSKWITANGKIIFPPMEYIVGVVDTAFTADQENDPSAMVILGVFRGAGTRMATPQLQIDEGDPVEFMRIVHDTRPKVMLMYAWQKRLTIHGPPEQRPMGLTDEEWNSPEWRGTRQQTWGLVEWVVDTCKRYKVEHLLIETQAQGLGLEQELRRLHGGGDASWDIEMIYAKGTRSAGNNKVARAHSVQHLFSNGLVYTPMNPNTNTPPVWADQVISQHAIFPRGKNDDFVDCCVHGLRHLRDTGILVRGEEHDSEYADELIIRDRAGSLYDV